jgi:uncharacterized hydrophobic protein (TIGR00271 family)
MSILSSFKVLADRGLTPEERRGVLEDLFVFGKKNQAPYLFRMGVLLVLSTIIATAGLLSDSAAVVIGAMLVAPLMNPVMAAAGAVVMGWSGRFYASLWLVFLMGLGALLLSSALTLASPELVFLPEQVLARTRPTYYDLLIALAAGSAGAYTITRKETSAIPGVAVAVALLPPLASAGVLLTTGIFELAVRALVLFLVNLIAMVLAGAVTFIAVGVSPQPDRVVRGFDAGSVGSPVVLQREDHFQCPVPGGQVGGIAGLAAREQAGTQGGGHSAGKRDALSQPGGTGTSRQYW